MWTEDVTGYKISLASEREQREANTNPLIKATTASLEPAPDIKT